MANKRRRKSKKQKHQQKQTKIFVGRKEPLQLFQKHLDCSNPEADDFIDILNIYGRGGVGKTYLTKEIIAKAKQKNALSAYVDEDIKNPIALMYAIAEQLAQLDKPLSSFIEQYSTYLKVNKKIKEDSKAPKGWISFLTKTAVKGAINMADSIPVVGGVSKMIDKDAAANVASELTTYLYSNWTNEAEIDLVLKPEEILTPLFLNDLWEYEEKHHLCFFVDTYEETGIYLDNWLRRFFDEKFGALPMNLTMVIAGRDELNAAHWSEHIHMIKSIPLEPFTVEESKLLLAEMNIEDEVFN